MKFLFISPHFPPEMQNFTRGLAEVGAEVFAVGDVPAEQLPPATRRFLTDYLFVENLRDETAAAAAIVSWVGTRRIDRAECLWEPFVLLAARVRERLGLPGMDYDTVLHFRDKDLMKQRLREGGVRVAKSLRVRSAKEIYAGAEQLGYPVVIKPISGAGSQDTYRLDSKSEIDRILPLLGHLDEGNLEEFIDGDEFTFDAVSIDGTPAFYSITKYYPRPLEARSNEWISPGQITYKDPDVPELADGVRLGKLSLQAMRMGTGFTHMEWFRKSDGEVVLGEIAVRSGGGHLVDLMNYANDFDVYREWARCTCYGEYEGKPTRGYFAGMIFKRAQGQGRISRIVGLETVRARLGVGLIWENLLGIGEPRRDWKQTLLSDGFIAFRHSDFGQCKAMLDCVVNDLKLYAE